MINKGKIHLKFTNSYQSPNYFNYDLLKSGSFLLKSGRYLILKTLPYTGKVIFTNSHNPKKQNAKS
ncbi:MAG: hypothetical protein B6D44_12160 [Ignavibacteriales bacterium UTCHB2]|nr:MAG: hypothetical protein B6D44_12160 [Ignavibacteriales bacterium UTCHB2]